MSGTEVSGAFLSVLQSSPISQLGLSPMHRTSRLGWQVCDSTSSWPRVDAHLWDLPFSLSSILRAQVPTQSLFFPTYVITWDLSKSLDYIRFLQPVSRYVLVRIIPHVDEFLMCSLGTVSSTSFYSAILLHLCKISNRSVTLRVGTVALFFQWYPTFKAKMSVGRGQ